MKRLDIVLAIAAIIGVSSATWCWWQLQQERAQVEGLQREVSELQSRLARSGVPLASPSDATPAASAPPAVPSAVTNSKPVPALSEEEAKELAQRRELRDQLRAAADRERAMMRDPAYRQSQQDEMRRRYAPRRAEAIRVGMTPEQADRVVDLEIARITRFHDLGGSPGQPPTEAMQADLKRAAEAEQAELRKLLGEDLFAKWNRYLASGQERAEVRLWRSQLSTTGEPLGDQEADALADSLHTERERRSREYEEYVKRAGIVDRNVVSPQDRQHWLDLEKQANQRTHDTMAGMLSSAQLRSLDEMLAARLAPVEAALRLQLEGKMAKNP
jgi:hypothetical protein